jgi:hypothetical protein
LLDYIYELQLSPCQLREGCYSHTSGGGNYLSLSVVHYLHERGFRADDIRHLNATELAYVKLLDLDVSQVANALFLDGAAAQDYLTSDDDDPAALAGGGAWLAVAPTERFTADVGYGMIDGAEVDYPTPVPAHVRGSS